MLRNINNHIALLLGLLGLISCSNNIGDVELLNLENEFDISLIQRLDHNGSHPVLLVKTVKEQTCGNSDLDITEDFSSNLNIITINGVSLETTCDNSPAKIQKKIDINLVGNSTSILVKLTSIAQNTGMLFENESEFELDFSTYDGINVVGNKIKKIEQAITWGTYNDAAIGLINKLHHDTVSSFQAPQYPEGNYGLFTVGQNQEFKIPDYLNPISENSVFFTNDFDLNELESIINSYEESPVSETNIQLTLQNHKGEVLKR